ncbi:hypothetical protein QBC46DRAFT_271756 [Diplogelasinospora grovesii]|uniref:Uncharacterized protein n=1 Tax=Diplogelasinospora grovesii TaxID=303347 RepID=A0AAN6RZZ2_9PEZI|nr:hypothetical protein QBC46DRAFT_271756 [Diplogelasinospora grovesii]
MNPLPKLDLTLTPLRHPASCVSLSLPLLNLLDAVLPKPPTTTFSVGSGTGLLEALFLARYPHRASAGSFMGIEVATPKGTRPVNRFLPQDNVIVVPGSWALPDDELLGNDTEALLFVYPRQPSLVKAYLNSQNVKVVVWIGPKCDLDAFVPTLLDWGELDQEGIEEDQTGKVVEGGEAIMVFRRKGEIVPQLEIDKI